MLAQIIQSATAIENVTDEPQHPMSIRVIRKVNGAHQWVILSSEVELTEGELRDRYCAMFNIYE